MKKKAEVISAVLDYRVNLLALEPTLTGLLGAGCRLKLFCADDMVPDVQRLFPADRISIISLDQIRAARPFWYKFHRVVRLLVTNPNFSWASWSQHQRALNGPNALRKAIYRFGAALPKLPGNQINRFMTGTVGRLTPDIFGTEKVISPSRTLIPEFVCRKGLKVYTLVESWDHPGKYPVGFTSETAFPWNKSIGEDWLRFQGEKSYTVGYPMKHRYVIEHAQKHGPKPPPPAGTQPVIMYAPSSTGVTSYRRLFEEEMIYLDELCAAAQKHGRKVFIKPKPQGNTHDVDFLAERYPNVILGRYKEGSGARPEDYFLDAQYNQRRLDEMSQCHGMINSGTTFGIDGAVFGLPVLQLDFRPSTRYPVTAKSYCNYHLETYFLQDPALTLPVRGDRSFFDVMDEYFSAPDGRDARYSERLRKWFYADEPFAGAIARIVETILR